MRKPYRLDVSSKDRVLFMFVNEYVPFKYFQNFKLPTDIQAIPIGINSKQGKLLILSLYKPPDQNLDFFFNSMMNMLDDCFNSLRTLYYFRRF